MSVLAFWKLSEFLQMFVEDRPGRYIYRSKPSFTSFHSYIHMKTRLKILNLELELDFKILFRSLFSSAKLNSQTF